MATYTTHLKLKKPDSTDIISPAPFNDNFDTIDTAIHNIPVDFVTNEITITISSTTTQQVLLSDSRVTSNSLADVYFTEGTIAEAEKLTNLRILPPTGAVYARMDSVPSGGVTVTFRIHVRVV